MRALGVLPLVLSAEGFARDAIAPVLPWDEGGWSARNWIGFFLYLLLFAVGAALLLRLGRSPGDDAT